jgi:hypothetical protein
MSNIVRIPAAATTPAAVSDYQKQNDLLYVFGLWGMGAFPLDLTNNKVVKGAIFNVGGVVYKASADETITGTPSNYVKLTPISAGAECSAVYVANLSGVSWSDTYNGYVDGSGNLYLFDELLALAAGAVTSPKTFIGRRNQSIPHGSQTITSGSGNFTVPAGVYSIKVTLIGGGGGGGGNVNVALRSGGGGGSGGRTFGFLSVVPGQSIAYSCGAGGAGGSAGNNAGSTGSNTTFTGITTANGGLGGSGSTTGLGRGGGGGTGTETGFPGHTGVGGIGGAGGGPGGLGGNGANGSVGQSPGGGGGGGGNASTGAAYAGGDGGSGAVIVEW